MKINFFRKSEDLSKLRSKLVRELSYDHGYSILRSSQTLKNRKDLLELSKDYDEYGYMSQNVGDELDYLFYDDEYIVGIHRTGYTEMTEENINNIFDTGLINNGHIMSGGITGNQDIEKTVSLFYDVSILNGQLKAASSYKKSEGCFIVRIPKSYLGKKDGDIKPIYHKKDGIVKLLPEFIYGYIPVGANGVVGEIRHNPNYKDVHRLDNVNLLYEDSALIKARKDGLQLPNQNLEIDVKYEILVKAYKETYEKYGKRQADYALLELINKNDIKYFTGHDNRGNLNKYVCYDDILSIICFGTNIESKDINTIIENFCNQVVNFDNNKKII